MSPICLQISNFRPEIFAFSDLLFLHNLLEAQIQNLWISTSIKSPRCAKHTIRCASKNEYGSSKFQIKLWNERRVMFKTVRKPNESELFWIPIVPKCATILGACLTSRGPFPRSFSLRGVSLIEGSGVPPCRPSAPELEFGAIFGAPVWH